MPLRNPREIGWRWVERGAADHYHGRGAMAGATMSHKHVRCLPHGIAEDCRRSLRCRQSHSQEDPPHHNHTKTIALHT